MDKQKIQKEIERLDALAHKNYMAHQECGYSRYLRASEKYEEQADIYRIAANAADDHMELVHLRATVNQILGQCKDVSYLSADERYKRYETAIKSLLAVMEWR